MPPEIRKEFGLAGREYVLNEKNSLVQTEKIKRMMELIDGRIENGSAV